MFKKAVGTFRRAVYMSTLSGSGRVQNFVQVLPIIKPSPVFPGGKILLCNWKAGDYQGRYTGIIQEYENTGVTVRDNSTARTEALLDFAQQILPAEISSSVSKTEIQLQGILRFDGPPETLEYVFVAGVKDNLISTNVNFTQHYPFIFKWFDLNEIPYQEMPADDEIWYKYVLEGKKIKGSFIFGGVHERTIKSYELNEVEHLDV